MSEQRELTYRELGVQEAFRKVGREAIRAHEFAAMLRINGNKDLRAGAKHYEAIGEMWARYAHRLLEANPPEVDLVVERDEGTTG